MGCRQFRRSHMFLGELVCTCFLLFRLGVAYLCMDSFKLVHEVVQIVDFGTILVVQIFEVTLFKWSPILRIGTRGR